jgi:hypothetical protein
VCSIGRVLSVVIGRCPSGLALLPVAERLLKSFSETPIVGVFSVVPLPYRVELTCHGAFIESVVLCMTFRHGYYVSL